MNRYKIAIAIFSLLFVMSLFVLYDVTEDSWAAWQIHKTANPIKPINYTITKPDLRPTAISVAETETHQETELASRQGDSREIREVSADGYLGKFRVTRYCPCEKCCGKYAKNRPTDDNGNPIVFGASGRELNSGYSCAADTSLPFGTKLYIPQIGMTFTVEDRAAKSIEKRYDGKFIDLYFTDHAHYIEGASDWMEVYIVE